MAHPFVLCQPSVQLPSSHASARNHPAFCPSPRHSHHPRPRPASGHEGPCTHSWESHTSHYTVEGLDSPAPPFSATPLIGLLGLTHCPFSIAKTRPTRPPSSDTLTEGQLPSHRCRQSQKHSNNSNITASTLPAGRNWQQAELPPRHLGPDQAHPTLGQGWQRHAAQSSHHSFRQELRNHLDPASQTLLDSQSGPHASRAFTTIPFGPDTTYQPHIFRILLLRRLRLALPLSARRCRRRRILDPLGDHGSACAQAIPRSPTRKSSRQSLPRSRRPRDYKHTVHGLKHRQHPAAR